MQFPVPQFTDVEDKIIGPLTIKQFGILFAVGMLIFLAYSTTKSVIAVILFFLVFGLPGLALVFVPFNGRPMYNFIGKLIKFIISPKELVFHKEVNSMNLGNKLKDVQVAKEQSDAKVDLDPQAHLRQVQELLNKTAAEEKDLAGRIK